MAVLLILAATPALAAVHHPSTSLTAKAQKVVALQSLEAERLVSYQMFVNKKDCWKKLQPIKLTQLAAQVYKLNETLPGAGIDVEDQKGYGSVMKDGFFEVDCVKDYMYNHGDAAGANKHEYEVGSTSGVSIVHYSMLVPKEDQQPMTSEVCFNFCRTVPDMLFFGLMAGRECYCAPFFKPMAGDSSKCDAVCEGNPTTMCGGMSKSSIFEMHFCDSTAEDLAKTAEKAGDFLSEAKPIGETAMEDAEKLQAAAETGQATFGNAGDTVMSDLMQSAKVFAGELTHNIEGAVKLGKELEKEVEDAKGMDGADFTDPEKMKKAEDLMKTMDEMLSKMEVAKDEAMKLHELARGTEYKDGELKKVDDEPLKQYTPIMYFVDKEYESMPSTCGGDTMKKPMLASSAQDCAAACDVEGIACAGFSYVDVKDAQDKVCFLFSKFKSVTYYTECKSFLQKPFAFLQIPPQATHAAIQKGNSTQEKIIGNSTQGMITGNSIQAKSKVGGDEGTMCYAKFASFTGMTLKPDPSGKCKACLKTADKAQRCFQ